MLQESSQEKANKIRFRVTVSSTFIEKTIMRYKIYEKMKQIENQKCMQVL